VSIKSRVRSYARAVWSWGIRWGYRGVRRVHVGRINLRIYWAKRVVRVERWVVEGLRYGVGIIPTIALSKVSAGGRGVSCRGGRTQEQACSTSGYGFPEEKSKGRCDSLLLRA
jgi:hypothetical protein